MNDSSPGFEAELRVSPKPVIAALAVLGAGIILTINPLFDSSEQLRILLIGVLILVTTAVAWRFEGRKPLVGRWLTMILLVAMVYLGHIWLDVPGILTLMVIPTAMAAVLIGLSAATATAVGQTMLLLLLKGLTNRPIRLAFETSIDCSSHFSLRIRSISSTINRLPNATVACLV